MRTFPFSRKLQLSVAFALAALAPRVMAQNTIYVDDDGVPPGHGTWNDPYTTIQRAISSHSTGNGDTIVVRAGTYRERLDFFSRSVSIVSESGPAQTIIDGDHKGSVVTIRSGLGWDYPCRIEGFTLQNGTGRYNAARGEALGGAIYCVNARLSVVDCTITHNSTRTGGLDSQLAGHGGGLYGGVHAELVLQSCTISDNEAETGGGVYLDQGSLSMMFGSLHDNRALGGLEPGRGGGIHAGAKSHLDLDGVDFERNLALGSEFSEEALGGGIRVEATGAAQIQNCTLAFNDSGGFSLGYGDLAGFGGGVSSMARAAEFSMSWTSIHDNWGNSGGGGFQGKGRLSHCTIASNIGQYGGGVSAVDATLTDCVLRDNYAGSVSGSYDWGGGIFVAPDRFGKLERCQLYSNHAFGQGGAGWGGIYVECDLHDNTAWGDASTDFVAGGGVFGGELHDCSLWNNSSHETDYQSAEGGGVYGGSAWFCIFYDNEADAGGGAMSAQLERCTIANNASSYYAGGGAGSSTVHDCIVRFNAPDDVDLCPSVTWSNVPAGTPGIGNIFSDPMLWNVGGRDYRLQPGSPCIDAGDPTSPPDFDGSRADMGAMTFGN